MKKKKIKAILFDIGGVLQLGKYSFIPFRRYSSSNVHKFMAKQFHITIDQWFDSIDTAYAQSIEGKISKRRVLSIMAKNLRTSTKRLENLFIYAYRKYFHRNNNLYEYAFNLKKHGYKIGILSDQWFVSKKALLDSKDSSKFDVSIISCDVKVRKPNSRIYQLALKKLKVNPHEAVFIDNQKWNLDAAEKLGIKTILFKSNRQTFRKLKNLGVKI